MKDRLDALFEQIACESRYRYIDQKADGFYDNTSNIISYTSEMHKMTFPLKLFAYSMNVRRQILLKIQEQNKNNFMLSSARKILRALSIFILCFGKQTILY